MTRKESSILAPAVAGGAQAVSEGGKNIGKVMVGGALLSVPALLGVLGYMNQKSRNNIAKDKEFEAQKRKLDMYTQAIRSVQ